MIDASCTYSLKSKNQVTLDFSLFLDHMHSSIHNIPSVVLIPKCLWNPSIPYHMDPIHFLLETGIRIL